MSDYTVVNFKRDVADTAGERGHGPNMEGRFGREVLGMEKGGVSYFRFAPNFEMPFGHTHSEQEEVYVVVSGNARVKLGPEEIELAQWDAVRVSPGVWRSLAGGPDGAEIMAFGAPYTGNKDAEVQRGFWG